MQSALDNQIFSHSIRGKPEKFVDWRKYRLQREHDLFDQAARRIEHLPEHFLTASMVDYDLYHWKGQILGPPGSCY